MAERGKIRNRERAKQLNDFHGLCYGKITPMDIDGFIDFGNQLFVFFEGKCGTAQMEYGQSLAFERLVDAGECTTCKPPRRSVGFIVRHDIEDPNIDVDYAQTFVTRYRVGGHWFIPKRPITLRAAIDVFHREYVPQNRPLLEGI